MPVGHGEDRPGRRGSRLRRSGPAAAAREIVELAAAPWEAVRPLGPATGNVRAHVVFKDGREMTRDAVLPACPPS